MTLEQIVRLTQTLDVKVEEGLTQLETTSIGSPEYNVILNNIVASSTLSARLKVGNQPTPPQTPTKGEA
jgi:hypothetical protein